jgi:hypothetical protein
MGHTFPSLKLAHELEERLVFADLQHLVLQRLQANIDCGGSAEAELR